jgi:hypothetical protein
VKRKAECHHYNWLGIMPRLLDGGIYTESCKGKGKRGTGWGLRLKGVGRNSADGICPICSREPHRRYDGTEISRDEIPGRRFRNVDSRNRH